MSLKAKVEAVVYAAEEPVTLAQLAGIFSKEIPEEIPPEIKEETEAELEAAGGQSDQSGGPAEIGATADINEGIAAITKDGDPGNRAAAAGPEEQCREEPQNELQNEPQSIPLFAPAPPQQSAEKIVDEMADQTADQPRQAIETDEKADEKKAARRRERQVRDALQQILDELIADYANGERGMEIREIAGGYRMATKPEYHDAVRGLVRSLKPPLKLSLQALETLAVVAYKQPVTGPEISEIRGVDSGGVLGSLMSRKLIATAGRKHVIGRPILYKTTKEFLLRFGLKDLDDLPSMEEFEKMAEELAVAESQAEDAAAPSSELPFREQEEQEEPPIRMDEQAGEQGDEAVADEGAASAEGAIGEDLGQPSADRAPDSPATASGEEGAEETRR